MLSLLVSIVIFILILSFLVIIHELGHFFAAKKAHIAVKEFGIGYPPLALKLFTWQGTDFTLNWVPFGGFVKMDGEEADPEDRNKQTKKGEFYAASVAQRLFVVLAGAAVNFIFGILAFAIIFSYIGVPQELNEARIGYLAPNSPVEQAGVQAHTSIIGFRVTPQSPITETHTSQEVIDFVQANRGQHVTMITTGQCDGLACDQAPHEYAVYIRTETETPPEEGSLGIAFEPVIFVHYPWWEMPIKGTVYGLEESLSLGKEILKALSKLGSDLVFHGQVSSELAGPVGIVHQAHDSGILNQGFMMVLSFAAMLSINLAIMNVLPIPPLDGGKALFTLLEVVLARKYLYKAEYWTSYAGYFLLMLLIVFITIRDVIKLFA